MYFKVSNWTARLNLRAIIYLASKCGMKKVSFGLMKGILDCIHPRADARVFVPLVPNDIQIDVIHKHQASRGSRIKIVDLHNGWILSHPRTSESVPLLAREADLLTRLATMTFGTMIIPQIVRRLDSGGFIETMLLGFRPVEGDRVRDCIELIAPDLFLLYETTMSDPVGKKELMNRLNKTFSPSKYNKMYPEYMDLYLTLIPDDFFCSEALVHGDLSSENILKKGDKVGVIDWEFSRTEPIFYDFCSAGFKEARNVTEMIAMIEAASEVYVGRSGTSLPDAATMAAVYSLCRVSYQIECRSFNEEETERLTKKHLKTLRELACMRSQKP